MFNWVFELTTQVFLHGGPSEANYDPLTQGVVTLARHPHPRTERYDGAGGVRPATEQEVTDYDSGESAREETARFQTDKAFRALVIFLAGKLGMTIQETRAEIVAIYRGL